MAKLIGAIGVSHTPTIGYARDRDLAKDPVWAPIFEAFAPLKDWLAEQNPDALVMIYNDHVTSFSFDHYSAFVLGVGDEYAVADEGGGPRDLPPVPGHAAFARYLTRAVMAQDFDLSVFQHKPLDHGCLSPLCLLTPPEETWPIPIVPLQCGVLQFPAPSARRCLDLGKALRKAIDAWPEDKRVVIVATGGLSHQVHGERAGFNNTAWDEAFLDMLQNEPDRLADMTHAEYAKLGGFESAEVIMWLIMRGAMSDKVACHHRTYYLPSMTAIATVRYEDLGEDTAQADRDRVLRESTRQLEGVEDLEGTYPFTLEISAKGYRINRFLQALVGPEARAAFLADPEAAFEAAALSTEERDLIRRRDWGGLIRYGAIFFVLEKLGAVLGVPNPQIYAAMKGMTLDAFLATRNAQITYSVSRQ
ncbi:gallate dioxygenase [Caulobacter hibisci]|uniref:Gallate dioxygenase n=1 Tax=Caulobacter hibisci TaxID=2035993 RepID=A0ABS0T0B8_9CAUL|nr:gallate dioxygenase [Caulobacter hibisci]MBI1684292.1 gallate dioxygenase [Caulobacter hibisci]